MVLDKVDVVFEHSELGGLQMLFVRLAVLQRKLLAIAVGSSYVFLELLEQVLVFHVGRLI